MQFWELNHEQRYLAAKRLGSPSCRPIGVQARGPWKNTKDRQAGAPVPRSTPQLHPCPARARRNRRSALPACANTAPVPACPRRPVQVTHSYRHPRCRQVQGPPEWGCWAALCLLFSAFKFVRCWPLKECNPWFHGCFGNLETFPGRS